MAISDPSLACKYHPVHNKKQGVCPSCLTEKLSQLYTGKNPYNNGTNDPMVVVYSSSLSPFSSGSSAPFSPVHRRHHQRNGSEFVGGSMSFRVGSGDCNGLKKSRSIAFVTSRKFVGGGESKSKKRGFWSKLLHLKGKKGLMHSVTMKEGRLY